VQTKNSFALNRLLLLNALHRNADIFFSSYNAVIQVTRNAKGNLISLLGELFLITAPDENLQDAKP